MLGPAAVQGWKTGLVATSTTGWLLCPSCASRAANYMPRSAGTGPEGHVLYETMPTDQMLGRSHETTPLPIAPPVQFLSEENKKCPHCDNVIKLEAVLCRFCRARFTVVEKGYCSSCHRLVEPSPDGRCPTCQGELLDRRKISQLVEEITPAIAAPPPVHPLVAQITCHKCKTVNPGEQVRCQSCNANLLPGEGIAMHIGYFLGGLAFTALSAWLLKGVMEESITYNLVCLKPGFLVFAGVGTLIWGFVKMVTPTPRFQRYANRAERHMELNLAQALADIDAATALAPKGERPGLVKKRQQIHAKLGDNQGALRDELDLALDPETHRTGANVMSMFNMDGDVYAESSSKQDRQALISSGKVKAFGYCKQCNDAVKLNAELKCPKHGGVKAIQYAIKGDEGVGKQKVMDEIGQKRMIAKGRRNIALAILVVIISAYFLINYFNDSDAQPSQSAVLPVATHIQPATTATVASATLAPAETTIPEKITAILFDDHQVTFEYPSNWEVIDDAGVQSLLRGTLKGIGDWEYIGGVYTKSPDDCLDCAQVTVTIIPLPAGYPGWSDEFYEQIKQSAQTSMGNRLQLHRQVKIGDYPGWEAIYLGKSGRTKLWDKAFLPSGEPVLVMVSAAANPDQFDQYLPVFEQAYASLSLYGAHDTISGE